MRVSAHRVRKTDDMVMAGMCDAERSACSGQGLGAAVCFFLLIRIQTYAPDGKISRSGGVIIRGVKVYVEVVILNNLALDALIVYAVLLLRRRKVLKLRFLSAVAVGAAVATAYPLLPEWAEIVVRVTLAPVVAALFEKHHGIKDYIISTVAGAALALLVAVRCILRARGRTARKICDAGIVVDGKEFRAEALCDSGNALTDAVSGLPVIIVSESFAEGVCGWHGSERASRIEGFVQLETVSGGASLPIVKVDGVRACGRETRAYAALAERDFEGYEVILQNTMF